MDNNTTFSCIGNSVTTLSRREKLARQRSSENGKIAVRESLSMSRRVRRPERLGRSRRTRTNVKKASKDVKSGACEEEEDDDDKVEIEKKIMALQKIVPGGEELGGDDNLFEKTAGYIMELQFQVKALKTLTSFVEGSEKERMKFGG